MNTQELSKLVDKFIKTYTASHGELSDGASLDVIYEIMSHDDIDNDEKIYCINDALEKFKT